jgi:hypothetical protein
MLTRGLLGTGLLTRTRFSTSLLSTGRFSTGRFSTGLLSIGLLVMGGLLTGCSTPQATFRPAGVTTPDDTGSPASPAHHMAGHAATGSLNWPPFGGNVHIFMPGWLPADRGEAPAVVAAKNFLLAFLYAEYRGNQDDRWTRYVSGDVLGALKANLSEPSVTTESFIGAINFSHMQAYPDPTTTGAIDVSECFDNSGSHNTSLATGKIIPDRIPADQHYYRNTDVLARRNGQWNVVSVYPVVYYPQAPECKS